MKAYKKLHKINIGKSGMVQQNEVKNLIKIKNFKKIGEFRDHFFSLGRDSSDPRYEGIGLGARCDTPLQNENTIFRQPT